MNEFISLFPNWPNSRIFIVKSCKILFLELALKLYLNNFALRDSSIIDEGIYAIDAFGV